jgi:hypothetical protein
MIPFKIIRVYAVPVRKGPRVSIQNLREAYGTVKNIDREPGRSSLSIKRISK